MRNQDFLLWVENMLKNKHSLEQGLNRYETGVLLSSVQQQIARKFQPWPAAEPDRSTQQFEGVTAWVQELSVKVAALEKDVKRANAYLLAHGFIQQGD